MKGTIERSSRDWCSSRLRIFPAHRTARVSIDATCTSYELTQVVACPYSSFAKRMPSVDERYSGFPVMLQTDRPKEKRQHQSIGASREANRSINQDQQASKRASKQATTKPDLEVACSHNRERVSMRERALLYRA